MQMLDLTGYEYEEYFLCDVSMKGGSRLIRRLIGIITDIKALHKQRLLRIVCRLLIAAAMLRYISTVRREVSFVYNEFDVIGFFGELRNVRIDNGRSPVKEMRYRRNRTFSILTIASCVHRRGLFVIIPQYGSIGSSGPFRCIRDRR